MKDLDIRWDMSGGLETVKDLDADREAVFQFDWIGRVPPTAEELAAC